MKRLVPSILFAALVSLGAQQALAVPITFSGSGSGPGGVGVSATATFDFTGNNLTILLRNTSPSNSGSDVSGSTLSGLYFDLTGNPTLTPVSATLAPGSTILQASQCDNCTIATTNLGGEFGYQAATGLPGGADRGISSSGYLTTGLSGNIGNFNNGAAGTDLDGPASLNGINFGIVSAAPGFNPNGGLANDPLVQDGVIFLLTGVAGLGINDISKVTFQYGTSLTELNIPGTPTGFPPSQTVSEPALWSLLALGTFGLLRRRR